MTRDELISALEKATGPDERLDREISIKCGWFAQYPGFTESRDAMLPGAEKLYFTVWINAGGKTAVDVSESQIYEGYNTKRWHAEAATEPLARRIAELKALVKT